MPKTTAPTERITCNVIGPRNDLGRPKLLMLITPSGLSAWCPYCNKAHVVTRQQVERIWAEMTPKVQTEGA